MTTPTEGKKGVLARFGDALGDATAGKAGAGAVKELLNDIELVGKKILGEDEFAALKRTHQEIHEANWKKKYREDNNGQEPPANAQIPPAPDVPLLAVFVEAIHLGSGKAISSAIEALATQVQKLVDDNFKTQATPPAVNNGATPVAETQQSSLQKLFNSLKDCIGPEMKARSIQASAAVAIWSLGQLKGHGNEKAQELVRTAVTKLEEVKQNPSWEKLKEAWTTCCDLFNNNELSLGAALHIPGSGDNHHTRINQHNLRYLENIMGEAEAESAPSLRSEWNHLKKLLPDSIVVGFCCWLAGISIDHVPAIVGQDDVGAALHKRCKESEVSFFRRFPILLIFRLLRPIIKLLAALPLAAIEKNTTIYFNEQMGERKFLDIRRGAISLLRETVAMLYGAHYHKTIEQGLQEGKSLETTQHDYYNNCKFYGQKRSEISKLLAESLLKNLLSYYNLRNLPGFLADLLRVDPRGKIKLITLIFAPWNLLLTVAAPILKMLLFIPGWLLEKGLFYAIRPPLRQADPFSVVLNRLVRTDDQMSAGALEVRCAVTEALVEILNAASDALKESLDPKANGEGAPPLTLAERKQLVSIIQQTLDLSDLVTQASTPEHLAEAGRAGTSTGKVREKINALVAHEVEEALAKKLPLLMAELARLGRLEPIAANFLKKINSTLSNGKRRTNEDAEMNETLLQHAITQLSSRVARVAVEQMHDKEIVTTEIKLKLKQIQEKIKTEVPHIEAPLKQLETLLASPTTTHRGYHFRNFMCQAMQAAHRLETTAAELSIHPSPGERQIWKELGCTHIEKMNQHFEEIRNLNQRYSANENGIAQCTNFTAPTLAHDALLPLIDGSSPEEVTLKTNLREAKNETYKSAFSAVEIYLKKKNTALEKQLAGQVTNLQEELKDLKTWSDAQKVPDLASFFLETKKAPSSPDQTDARNWLTKQTEQNIAAKLHSTIGPLTGLLTENPDHLRAVLDMFLAGTFGARVFDHPGGAEGFIPSS